MSISSLAVYITAVKLPLAPEQFTPSRDIVPTEQPAEIAKIAPDGEVSSGRSVPARRGVQPADPFSIGAATLLLAVVSILAGYVWAQRAASYDSVRVLRYE